MQITIPHDLKIETFCLGSILNSINAANEAFSTLEESDFFDVAHQKFFTLMKSTFVEDTGCNLSTMFAKMGAPEGNFSKDYLLFLDSNAWSGMPYEEYFASLRNLSGLRRAYYAAQNLIVKACSPNANYDEVIGEHQTHILRSMGINTSTLTANEIYKNYKNNLSFVDYSLWKRERFFKGVSTFEGVETGYPILDQTLGSLQNGALYYIGARTSMGKTTFILNLICNIMTKKRVGVFSLEMTAQMIFEKLICIFTGVKYSDFSLGKFSDSQLETIKSLDQFLSKDCLFIEDEQSMSFSKLAARAKRMKKSHDIDILFIDYLTLIKSDNKHPNKHMQVDEVSKGLQSLAKALKIPVVCLTQLNRAAIGKDGDKPTLAHFRESGSIEEDADACLLLHRPDYYDKHKKPGYIELIVAKNRIMGNIKTIDYHCDSNKSERYEEIRSINEHIQEITGESIHAKVHDAEHAIFGR